MPGLRESISGARASPCEGREAKIGRRSACAPWSAAMKPNFRAPLTDQNPETSSGRPRKTLRLAFGAGRAGGVGVSSGQAQGGSGGGHQEGLVDEFHGCVSVCCFVFWAVGPPLFRDQ